MSLQKFSSTFSSSSPCSPPSASCLCSHSSLHAALSTVAPSPRGTLRSLPSDLQLLSPLLCLLERYLASWMCLSSQSPWAGSSGSTGMSCPSLNPAVGRGRFPSARFGQSVEKEHIFLLHVTKISRCLSCLPTSGFAHTLLASLCPAHLVLTVAHSSVLSPDS